MNISGGQIKMVSCSGFVEPLNLQCWLVNIFSGTSEIFLFIMVLALAGLAGMFRMRNDVTLLMLALFGIMFAQFESGLYVLVVLIGGLISFTALKKIVSTQ